MWQDHGPGVDVVPAMDYSANWYTARAVEIIRAHDPAQPLWLHLAYQNVHAPYVNPPDWEVHRFPKMWDNVFANMLNMLDSGIGNVTAALKAAGLYDNTLIVWSADNGGIGPANNHPLRGHKHDAWEGGTRVASFVSGGFVPARLRGTRDTEHLVYLLDWYATLSVLAGVDPADDAMFEGAVRPIDAVDVWPMLTGANDTQPRPFTPTSDYGLIHGWWKVVTLGGQSNYYDKNATHVNPAGTNLPCLAGAQPHSHNIDNPVTGCVVCNATLPCLFDLSTDPGETTNLAADNPELVAALVAKLDAFQPYGTFQMNASQLAQYQKIDDPSKHWGGFAGPCYMRGSGPGPSPGPAPATPPCGACRFETGVHDDDDGSAVSIDIHLPVAGTAYDAALAANAFLNKHLNSTSIDFSGEHAIPHVTLYLTRFSCPAAGLTNPAPPRTCAQTIEDAISGVKYQLGKPFGPCTLTLSAPYAAGSYAMMNVTKTACLQGYSDTLVNATHEYSEPNQTAPGWVKNLPEPERSEALRDIAEYGSPNVFAQFAPHVSLAWSADAAAVAAAVQALAPRWRPASFVGDVVAMGSVGPHGTVLRGKDLATYNMTSRGDAGCKRYGQNVTACNADSVTEGGCVWCDIVDRPAFCTTRWNAESFPGPPLSPPFQCDWGTHHVKKT